MADAPSAAAAEGPQNPQELNHFVRFPLFSLRVCGEIHPLTRVLFLYPSSMLLLCCSAPPHPTTTTTNNNAQPRTYHAAYGLTTAGGELARKDGKCDCLRPY